MNPNEMRTRFRNMLATKPREWYRVENQAAGPTQIHIYDDIGMAGIQARDLVDDLNRIKGPIELHINSGGGEIFDAFTIHTALSARDVAVYIDGVAASAASFIAMAASTGKLFMAKNASMMIHDGQTAVAGDATELAAMVDILNRESQKIAGIYAERTGKSTEYFRNKMRETTWYDAREALAEGLIDAIFDARTGSLLTNAMMMPEPGEMGEDKDEENEGWIVRDGKWVFDPDNDGDDDSRPETDTDHGYWSEDGRQLQPIPPKPKGPPTAKADNVVITNADVDDSPWDAAKAWHNGTLSKNPEAFYRAICAGEKTTGDPATQAHWALPYRYTPDSPPNAAGVRNALARLSQTQGLKNESEARSKLEGLMKKVNPDYKPSDSIDTALLANALRDALIGGK